MKRLFKRFRFMSLGFVCALFSLLFAVPAYAEGESLSINFSVSEMFTWAQTIIDALMPVVYVTMGIGLGFLIIRALRSAFN